HFTSLAVNGLPSCHLMPWRNLNVSALPSSLHDQLSASSGSINSGRFCLSCWLNKTRLLKTLIIGATVEIVASSWIDMLPGLSRWKNRSVPPFCCAAAGPATSPSATIAAKPSDNELLDIAAPCAISGGKRNRFSLRPAPQP